MGQEGLVAMIEKKSKISNTQPLVFLARPPDDAYEKNIFQQSQSRKIPLRLSIGFS
jgi:hypothetical protein